MKVLIFAILLVVAGAFPAISEEQNVSESYLPTEFSGYIVYEGVNSQGEKVHMRKPVRYKLYNGEVPEDNDRGYEYRNYRMEYEKEKEEQGDASERNNINSAANYPIYFNE